MEILKNFDVVNNEHSTTTQLNERPLSKVQFRSEFRYTTVEIYMPNSLGICWNSYSWEGE